MIVAVVVETVGLLYNVNEMQALVVAHVEPDAVMLPVELSWPKTGTDNNKNKSNRFMFDLSSVVRG